MNELVDFKFKKKFGQNFLKDKNILNKIVEKSLIDKDTLVLEIGVGAGALTFLMSEKAKNIIGYEIDTDLKNYLLDNKPSNVEIIFGDFLKQNIKEVIKKYDYKKLYVVANLPYYITTPIIQKIIDEKINVDKMVIMVQKEVGDRFRAKPNTKEYNSLSVYLNYYFDIKKLIDVSKNCFIPSPNVDSVVVSLEKKEKQNKVKNEDLFFKLVRDSFKFKRKTLKNNLKSYDLVKIREVLNKYNLDLSVRAEQLSIDMFIEIINNL